MSEITLDVYRDELADAHRAGKYHPSANCPLCGDEPHERPPPRYPPAGPCTDDAPCGLDGCPAAEKS